MMDIEIAYASLSQQTILQLKVPLSCTVLQAIEQSGILQQFPEINLQTQGVGIFSKRVSLEHILQPRDRIEIYRTLLIDPKQARRIRAKKS